MEWVRLMVMYVLSTKQSSEKLGISVKVLGTWKRKYLNDLKRVSSKESALSAAVLCRGKLPEGRSITAIVAVPMRALAISGSCVHFR